jgi:hypothetical protein
MPVNGLWCNYRFGNSIAGRGESPDPAYIFPRLSRDPLHRAIYILYRRQQNKIKDKFFKKKFITPLDSHSEKN